MYEANQTKMRVIDKLNFDARPELETRLIFTCKAHPGRTVKLRS